MKQTELNSQPPRLRIMLSGARGAMGQAVERCCSEAGDVAVVARYDKVDGFGGQPLGDVVLDVSHHSRLPHLIEFASDHGLPLLVGTTGLSDALHAELLATSKTIPVCWARNFSLGAQLLIQMAVLSSKRLKGSSLKLTETHHQHKKDAPSGTALMIQQAIEAAGGGSVEISSVREGEVIGTHSLRIVGREETLTLTHEVTDRAVFARGALTLAQQLSMKPPGWYVASDLLD